MSRIPKSFFHALRPLALGAGLAMTVAGCRAAPAAEAVLGDVTTINSPAGPGSAEPNLSVAPDGRVLLSWLEPVADSAHELRFATWESEQWSPVRTIERGDDWFVNWADFPSLLALPDGRLAAHYLQRHPGGSTSYDYGVRIVQSTDNGESWSAPVIPHRDGVPAEHGFVSLFPAEGDSLGAIWLDGRKSHPSFGGKHEMTLRYTTLAPDGTLGAEVAVDQRICDCCQTSVAHTAQGPVVVYRNRTEEEIRDIYVTRLVDGAWTEGKPVHDDRWEIAACPVNGPSVSASENRVATAWFTAARDTARVQVAFSDDAGVTWGEPIRVDAGDPAGRVDVELLADGGALVSWIERTEGENAEVRVRHVAADGAAGEPMTIASSSGARASGFPRMVRRGDQVFFAWTEPGNPSRVRVAYMNVRGES